MPLPGVEIMAFAGGPFGDDTQLKVGVVRSGANGQFETILSALTRIPIRFADTLAVTAVVQVVLSP